MPKVTTLKTLRFYVYALDFRDKDYAEVSFDTGISEHPSNWGGNVRGAIVYSSYLNARSRMLELYSIHRAENEKGLIGLSFGILTSCETKEISEPTDDERMQEILSKFGGYKPRT